MATLVATAWRADSARVVSQSTASTADVEEASDMIGTMLIIMISDGLVDPLSAVAFARKWRDAAHEYNGDAFMVEQRRINGCHDFTVSYIPF